LRSSPTLLPEDADMATATPPIVRPDTMADLLARLGDIPPGRVLMTPTPGTATEQDVIDIHGRENRLCELIDGVLVEKTMGFEESGFAALLVYYLIAHLRDHDIGRALGADGMIRLFPGRVRIPDACFISWDRYPRTDEAAIPDLAPDLVVEILSKGNSRREMNRKLGEYFEAGVRLVWYVDPRKRTARVYTSPSRSTLLREGDHLDGGDVLPGFRLALRDWFAEAGRRGPKAADDAAGTES
jgi:Uma2 family endonuclease